MSSIPIGWVLTTISELVSYIQRGKSPNYTDHSELPVINQKCIRWNELEIQYLKYIHSDQFSSWDEARYIRPGDILWNSTGTGTVGRAYLVSEDDCVIPKVVDSHVTIVRVCDEIDQRYVYNWIKGPVIQHKIVDMCDGSTNQIELNRKTIADTEIPLAPLNEQKRIADKLDKILARVDACRERLDRIPDILKRFRQAVLAAATSGKLTEDWRGKEHTNWKSVALETVANIIDPHPSHRTPKEVLDGVPYIGIGDLKTNGSIDFENARKVSLEVLEEHKARYKLKKGDFVFGKIGTLGKATILPVDIEYTLSANVILIQPHTSCVLSTYLMFFLSSPETMEEIARQSNSTSQAAFGIKKMRSFKCRIPEFKEQTEIVRRVESLLAYADRLEARYHAARAQVDKLTPAILAKAFRGELVPQDPNDEPASVLLGRIRASRAENAATPKPKRSRAITSRKTPDIG